MADETDRNLNRYIIRFPDGMRDRLKEHAEKNKRTLNAEIIARLEATLDPPMQLLFNLADEGPNANLLFEAMAKQSTDMIAQLQKRIAELEASQAPLDQTMGHVNVTLDANGNPISWGEIREHLKAIRQAGDFDVWSMNATIQNATVQSSSEREKEARSVANFYRRQRKPASPPPPDTTRPKRRLELD